MSKLILKECKVCGKVTTWRKKHKFKVCGRCPDLNLLYCMNCRDGYNSQLLGRNRKGR